MYKFNSMTLAATLTLISESDHTLMRRVHRWHAPRWIRVWMVCATRGGDGWLWYALGLAILWLGGNRRFAAIGAAALAAGMGIAAFLNLKKATGRKRPCALEPLPERRTGRRGPWDGTGVRSGVAVREIEVVAGATC